MMFPPKPLWTPEEDDELRSSILASKDIATIAKYLNRTRTAIRRRAAKLKLPLKVVTVGLKAREISNANDDKSPLIDLLTCIVCNATMKIAKTAPEAGGSELIKYRCELCGRIELVRLLRGRRDAAP